jgi:formylglycine-generating enzyme required for sulfatase activity
MVALCVLAGCPQYELRSAVEGIVARGTVPDAPADFVATPVSSSSIRLSWTDSSANEIEFSVERSAQEGQGFQGVATPEADAVTYDDVGLLPSTTYYYRICAANTAGASAFTAIAQAITSLAAPTSLTVTVLSSTSVRLSWTDNSADEEGFRVERCAEGTDAFASVATTAANATSYDDIGLAAGTCHDYRVFATNGRGDSDCTATVSGTPVLLQPTGLAASAASVSRIRLSWADRSPDETGFGVERSLDPSSGFTEIALLDAGATSCDDRDLVPDTTYHYRVRAVGGSISSEYSIVASATTEKLLAVTMVSIPAAGDSFTTGDTVIGPNQAQAISYNYRLSRYEVTNALFAQFVADGGYETQAYWTSSGWEYAQSESWVAPAYWNDARFDGDSQPVQVSRLEAVAFCIWRSIREGLAVSYDGAGQATLLAAGYRLPTEVEWEYAAAKGAALQAERIYAWGDTFDSGRAVCSVSPSASTTTGPVGSTAPYGDTPRGLCDMTGNLWEWCADNYVGLPASGTDTYTFSSGDPGEIGVLRGGAWSVWFQDHLRNAVRLQLGVHVRGSDLGFRLCRP